MVFVFNEVVLPKKGKVRIGLSSIYGIGLQRAGYLLTTLGINKQISIKRLSKYHFNMLSSVIRKYLLVDSAFRRKRVLAFRSFSELKTYRSVRYRMNLPIRGQSTRTNARTAKRVRNRQK